jgi:hypothetical protein
MEGETMTCSVCGEGEYVIKHNESGSMSYTEPVNHLDCVLRLQEENEKLRASLLDIHDSPRGDVVVLEAELAALKWENAALRSHQACTKRAEQAEAENKHLRACYAEAEESEQTLIGLLAQSEAELAALTFHRDALLEELDDVKARTCETCLHAGDIAKSGTSCRVCKRIWGWVPLSAGCDEWEAWT